jgi:hypothetical protein
MDVLRMDFRACVPSPVALFSLEVTYFVYAPNCRAGSGGWGCSYYLISEDPSARIRMDAHPPQFFIWFLRATFYYKIFQTFSEKLEELFSKHSFIHRPQVLLLACSFV